MEDSFSMDYGGGWFADDSSALCLLCTLLLLHQLHLRSSSIRSWRLETMTYNPRRGWPSPNSSLSSDNSLSQIYSLLVFKCEGSQLVLLRWSVGANPFNLIIVSALLFLFTHLFWLHWVFVAVWGLSLVVASRCCSPVAVWGLLIAVASLVEERGLLSTQASVAAVETHGPSCPEACGIFLDQGSNPCPLRWQMGSQPLDHQGSPVFFFFFFLAIHHNLFYFFQKLLGAFFFQMRFLIKKIFFYYWSIIALQCCVSFCCMSALFSWEHLFLSKR